MTTLPSICAIVINYFGAEKTARCLRSLAQEPLTTLLLVDNSASKVERCALDGLVIEMREAGVTFAIHPLYNDENLGFGRAINAAIAKDVRSGGHDYYLLFNNDAEATPGLIHALVSRIQQSPDIGLVSPRIRWGNGELCYYWYQPYLGHVSRGPFPGSFRYLSGCCLLVDASLAIQGQLFDEAFFMYGEDVWLTWIAGRRRRGIACADNALVLHEGSGSSRQGGYFYEYHVARGHVLLAFRLAKTSFEIPLLLVARFFYLLARSVIRSFRYRSAIPFLAFGASWLPAPVKSCSDHAPS